MTNKEQGAVWKHLFSIASLCGLMVPYEGTDDFAKKAHSLFDTAYIREQLIKTQHQLMKDLGWMNQDGSINDKRD